MRERIAQLLAERARVQRHWRRIPGVQRIWPSDANFLLVQFADPDERARARARRRPHHPRRAPGRLLPRALRISVGTPAQNDTC